MPPVGFEPTISAGERPQTYALDRAATGTGDQVLYWSEYNAQYFANDKNDTQKDCFFLRNCLYIQGFLLNSTILVIQPLMTKFA